MDECDVAQDYAERHTREAIDKALAAWTGRGESAETCAWCEKPIPEARRLAAPGCDLCARCQTIKERLPGRRA